MTITILIVSIVAASYIVGCLIGYRLGRIDGVDEVIKQIKNNINK